MNLEAIIIVRGGEIVEVFCDECKGENIARATVALSISTGDQESLNFFTQNKLVVLACKDCKHVGWRIG
jgi:hypothetical protein